MEKNESKITKLVIIKTDKENKIKLMGKTNNVKSKG